MNKIRILNTGLFLYYDSIIITVIKSYCILYKIVYNQLKNINKFVFFNNISRQICIIQI